MPTFNRKDDDGHKYLIPEDLLDKFDSLLAQMQNTPFMSSENWSAESDFIEIFSDYMVD